MRRIIMLLGLSAGMLSSCAQLNLIKTHSPYDYSKLTTVERSIHKRAERFLKRCIDEKQPVAIVKPAKIEKVSYDPARNQIKIYFNSYFAYNAYRDGDVTKIYQTLRKDLGRRFRKANLTIYTINQPLEQLVPNFYRQDRNKLDLSRLPKPTIRPEPVVRNLSRPFTPQKGLNGQNIALWHSHGWYYSISTQRWEWQRPRLFQTVEDLFPAAFVLPYMIPMLENAGANVFTPRERDTQTNSVVIDNDSPTSGGNYLETGTWQTGAGKGFAVGQPPYKSGINPFQQGTFRFTTTAAQPDAGIKWIPEIPEDGDYAVYIAYSSSDSNATDVHYTVFHSGGKTEFAVNQQIGGSTWIYLGTFNFKAGRHPETAQVVLSNQSQLIGKIVSADAVRFGGGMGNIARGGAASGRPRFTEAARYNLQYSGLPDTLVYTLRNGKDDYYDDYSGRGEWVNYLRGNPFGPNKDRTQKGLGIPIDLSLAFHTDAGIVRGDSVIGTLSIYSVEDFDSALVFPDGVSRMANRDLADILQTQIVDDIRAKWDPQWNRRQLYNRQYGESYRPNVPAALIELLSHQNFNDMRFGNDPRFRADVSRAFYKGMLKFLAGQNQTDYVVEPLAVTHFQIEFVDQNSVRLQWRPQSDPLEPTAEPTGYIVYSRRDDGGFDNGFLVNEPFAIINDLQPGVIYGYKVTAINDGGESRPSEILAVCVQNEDIQPVLIINGFDRVCGPETLETPNFIGFAGFLDQGVPDGYDLNYTGAQFDFIPNSPWITNDLPGWGASHADYETTIIPGNTHDFTYIHGQAIKNAGHAFASASDEAVWDNVLDITKYKVIDLILGEEKETLTFLGQMKPDFKTFPSALQQAIGRFTAAGGKLLVSGSYIGTDLFMRKDSNDINFAQNVLKYKLVTHHAAAGGDIFTPGDQIFGEQFHTSYNAGFDRKIYTVEAPDAIAPADSLGKTILRYAENSFSAGVAYSGTYKVIALGFPFETILTAADRDRMMAAMLKYLVK